MPHLNSPRPPSITTATAHFLRARLSPDGYLGLHLTLGMVAILLALFVFGHIAGDVVTGGGLLRLDEPVLQWLHAHATPGRTAFFFFITEWHNTLGILAMTALLGLWMWHEQQADRMAWLMRLLLSVPLGMLLNVLLKHIFQRQRPAFDQPLLTLVSYSFPSGHTAAATLFYGVLAAWLVSVHGRKWLVPVVLVALTMVALVATSRVYLGVHYPSDVLAAMASSTAWLAIVLTGMATWGRRQARRSRLSAPS